MKTHQTIYTKAIPGSKPRDDQAFATSCQQEAAAAISRNEWPPSRASCFQSTTQTIKHQAGRAGTTELAPIDTNTGCRFADLTLQRAPTSGPACTPHKQPCGVPIERQAISGLAHTRSHEEQMERGGDRSGGKGCAAQMSPRAACQQKNSTPSENSKVSPTSCSSYVVLTAPQRNKEASKSFESPEAQESRPPFKVCSTTTSAQAKKGRFPMQQQGIDSSAYSIKPFATQQNQQHMLHTPEPAATQLHMTGREAPTGGLDSKSHGKAPRRLMVLPASGQAEADSGDHQTESVRQTLFKDNYGEVESQVDKKSVAKELKQTHKDEQGRPCSAEIKEAFSAFSQLIIGGGAPKAQAQHQTSSLQDEYEDSGEISKLDQNAAQIKLGFSLLLKADFVDLMQALTSEQWSLSDKSFDLPQYDKSVDYSKLAVESQSQLFKLRSEVDQAGLKYLTPQNQVSHLSQAPPANALKRLHHQQSSVTSQQNGGQLSGDEQLSEDEPASESSNMNKRCLKLLQKSQPISKQMSVASVTSEPQAPMSNSASLQPTQKADTHMNGMVLTQGGKGLPQSQMHGQCQANERIAGKNGPRKQRTVRRVATLIQKDFKCFFCQKVYGSEAAAIMHMRNKHKAGTKQDIERGTGISVREGLLHADDNAKEWLQNKLCTPTTALAPQTSSQVQVRSTQPMQ